MNGTRSSTVRIGKIAEENPDLPRGFVKNVLVAGVRVYKIKMAAQQCLLGYRY